MSADPAAWDIPHEARAFQGRSAGVVSRTVAAVLDALVVAVVLLAMYVGVAATLFVLDPTRFTFPAGSLLFSLAAALVVLVIYLTAAWSVTGRTYGCRVMGLRVVTTAGTRVKVPRAFLRAVACGLFPWALFWCAVSRRSLSLQDIVLRTRVVYDWRTAAPFPGPRAGEPGAAEPQERAQ